MCQDNLANASPCTGSSLPVAVTRRLSLTTGPWPDKASWRASVGASSWWCCCSLSARQWMFWPRMCLQSRTQISLMTATGARHRLERQYHACANCKKQCKPNETKLYSEVTHPRKRQDDLTNGHTPSHIKSTHTRLTYTGTRPHAPGQPPHSCSMHGMMDALKPSKSSSKRSVLDAWYAKFCGYAVVSPFATATATSTFVSASCACGARGKSALHTGELGRAQNVQALVLHLCDSVVITHLM